MTINDLPDEELLTQLAEECAELSKAALKLRRTYPTSCNPTPITKDIALRGISEETADVSLICDLLKQRNLIDSAFVEKTMTFKLERWNQRLQEKRKT